MTLPKEKVQAMYQSAARGYDLTTLMYRIIGLRMKKYRSLAVERLRLQRGDHVVELGCGTGLNFPLLLKHIGPEGRLTGVDFTPGMLELARAKVEQAGWTNVELVQADISSYDFPQGITAVLATGVFGYIADHDRVIQAASRAIIPGGRLVILDGKQPEHLRSWQFQIVLRLGRPFGFTPDYFKVHPWQSVERYFRETVFERMYGGMIYVSSGRVV